MLGNLICGPILVLGAYAPLQLSLIHTEQQSHNFWILIVCELKLGIQVGTSTFIVSAVIYMQFFT